MSKLSPPSPVAQPLFPIKPGSVLSQLMDSAAVASSHRFPKLFSGAANQNVDNKEKPRSKIPTTTRQSVQSAAFERSLRRYGNNNFTSPPTSPTSASYSKSRDQSPRSTKIPTFDRAKSVCGRGKSLGVSSKPPRMPPRTAQEPVEIRPTRLAYSIPIENQNKPTTCNNQSCWQNKYGTKKICHQENERSIRMLHTQAVVAFERSPVTGPNGIVICPCEHDEKASQTLSAEMLQLSNRKRSKTVLTHEQETMTNEEKCMSCATLKSELEKVNNNNNQKTVEELQEQVSVFKRKLEKSRTKNEKLELQLFENKEKLMEVIEMSAKKNVAVVDIGVETEEGFRDKLKFSLHNFLEANFQNLMTSQDDIGDADSQNVMNRGKSVKVALAAREAFINELKVKLKRGQKIFQQRCNALLKTTDLDGNDSNSCYKQISPPEAEIAFHSYRRFVRFLHTYMEESLAEMQEFDRVMGNAKLDSNHFHKEMELEINGNAYAGIFLPLRTLEVKKAEVIEQQEEEIAEEDQASEEIIDVVNSPIIIIEETDKLRIPICSEIGQQTLQTEKSENIQNEATNTICNNWKAAVGEKQMFFDFPLQRFDSNSNKLSSLRRESITDIEHQVLNTPSEELKTVSKLMINCCEEKVKQTVSSMEAAKHWLDNHKSSMTTFILSPPRSITNFSDPTIGQSSTNAFGDSSMSEMFIPKPSVNTKGKQDEQDLIVFSTPSVPVNFNKQT